MGRKEPWTLEGKYLAGYLITGIATLIGTGIFADKELERVYNASLEQRAQTAQVQEAESHDVAQAVIQDLDNFEVVDNEGKPVYQETDVNANEDLASKYSRLFNEKHNPPVPLSPKYVRSMAMVEGNTDHDPMQIANQGDFALETLANGGERTHLIGDFSKLKGKNNTPWKNGRWDASESNMTAEDSYLGGVGWIFHKAAIYDTRIVEEGDLIDYTIKEGDSFWKISGEQGTTEETLRKYNPKVVPEDIKPDQKIVFKKARKEDYIAGWRPWKEAIARYNGGGDSTYVERVLNLAEVLD
tara:strand:- start:87 stop:983 length:897 start_codon:yes stop_codon:yes gene_type:complete